jgi:hypothetical protein
MTMPWSISTTVRNPERLRDFLQVLQLLEGKDFNRDNQIKYQVLLIQKKFYHPENLPPKLEEYYNRIDDIPYKTTAEIFAIKNYEDPPMRGRQSVNPLNKLGYAIAMENAGPITITDLGKAFVAGDYDINFLTLN